MSRRLGCCLLLVLLSACSDRETRARSEPGHRWIVIPGGGAPIAEHHPECPCREQEKP